METVLSSDQEPGCFSRCTYGGGGQRSLDPQSLSSSRQHNNPREDSRIAVDIVREMNELSFQERQQVLEEIHGVAGVQEETPEFVAAALSDLDSAINNLPRPVRRALDRAYFLKPSLATDSNWKLMFLRRVYFDPGKAAMRMAIYFQNKLRLFGEDKLVKRITLDDLGEQEKSILRLGGLMMLAERDPTGRPILFLDPSRFILDDHDVMIRASWYHFMPYCIDEDAQRKGIVHVVYIPHNFRSSPPARNPARILEHVHHVGKIVENMPIRMSSYHFCYQNPGMHTILAAVQRNFGKYIRLHIRTHLGSATEICYSLMTFGISCHDVPQVDQNEQTVKKLMDEYFADRLEIETNEAAKAAEVEASSVTIAYPKHTDILIGRGRPYYEFSGTRRLLVLIDSEKKMYPQVDEDKFQKTCISISVVRKVHDEWNARFLQRTQDGWKVLDDDQARKKVINLLRYSRDTGLASVSENSANHASRGRTKRPKLM